VDIVFMLIAVIYMKFDSYYFGWRFDFSLTVMLCSPVFLILDIIFLPVYIYRLYKKTVSARASSAIFILFPVQLILVLYLWRIFYLAALSGL
jgi:hypothetical protein